MIRARSIVFGGMGIALLALGGHAFAGSATSNLSISATVQDNCTITANSLSFGAYDPVSGNASAPLTGSGTISVTCTSGSSATITLDQGTNPGTSSTSALPKRRMSNGA